MIYQTKYSRVTKKDRILLLGGKRFMTEESGVLNSKVRRINLKVILLNQLK